MADLKSHEQKLTGYLARFKETGVMNHIAGESLPSISGDTFRNISPVDETYICDVAKSSQDDVDAAAAAAKEAFAGWRDMEGVERKKILHAIADGIVARAEEIATGCFSITGLRKASTDEKI